MPTRSVPLTIVQGAQAAPAPKPARAPAQSAIFLSQPTSGVAIRSAPVRVLAGQNPVSITTVNPSGQAVGIDISAYEGFLTQQASAPLDFAIIKASEGVNTSWEAKTFNANYNVLAQRGVPVIGAYHYLRTDYPVGDQVSAFLNATQGKNLSFYAVDVEQQQGNAYLKTPGQLALYAQQARDFAQQLQARTPTPVFLYTNQSIYNEFFNRPQDKNLPLWLSIPTQSHAFVPGTNAAIQQTDFGAPAQQFGVQTPSRGGAFGVDYDIFNGSSAQMQAYINSLRR